MFWLREPPDVYIDALTLDCNRSVSSVASLWSSGYCQATIIESDHVNHSRLLGSPGSSLNFLSNVEMTKPLAGNPFELWPQFRDWS